MVTTDQTADKKFLERVQASAGLEDIYDARDITEVVFRTLRDLMKTEASDRIESNLRQQMVGDEALTGDVAELWRDTNPLVRFLSRVRPPLEFDDETFLFRISQEAGLSRGITPEMAISAVFAATKVELSSEHVQEIADILPGRIKQLWRQA